MTYIIGIDPGPVVGMCLLRLPGEYHGTQLNDWYAELAQVSPNCVQSLLTGWHEAYEITAVVAELFVDSAIAMRANAPKASRAARDVLSALRRGMGLPSSIRYIERRACDVKPWATDSRLKTAGLIEPTTNMRHARDAARHALFSACRDFGAQVPRSVRVAARTGAA